MQLQLDLFKPIAEEVDLSAKANLLLFALNDGLKKSEMYEPTHYAQINDLVVLIAQNKQNNKVFNVINVDGKTPENFSVCWRNASHVKQDILEHLEKQGTLIN
jgi:hypothetical protein